EDPTMPKGARVVEDTGIDGRSIVVKRIVEKDGKVVRTDSFTSVYRPKVEVVRLGTKKTTSKEATVSAD
ncbi:MAG: G5 domain-containing protein, partial [Coriobacteriia bacterium]|nr:G5 domain-containing protein [Coriobacteriia bacterium]